MRRMLLILLLVQATDGALAQVPGDRTAPAADESGAMEAARSAPQDMPEASLGIGFDVFPRAFGFAASRVGVPADLDMLGCKGERCDYNLGSGVTISADHLPKGLDIHRIEASLDTRHSRDPAVRFQFEQACLAIVALVDPRASRDEQQATATAISVTSGPTIRRFQVSDPEKSVRVYGLRMTGTATTATALRCGAVAVR